MREMEEWNTENTDRIREMQHYSRQSNLILRCDVFSSETKGDNTEMMVVKLLNERFPDQRVSVLDFSVSSPAERTHRAS